MSGYFDEEDADYNSDGEKSIMSKEDEGGVYSVKKKKSVTKVKTSNPLQNIINSDDEDNEDEPDNDDDNEDDDEDEDDEDDDDEIDDIEDEGEEKTNLPVKKTAIPIFEYENEINEDDEEDESDEDEEESNDLYIKKFDRELNANFIESVHPESQRHNYDEIESLSKIFRNKNGQIVDDLHKTNPYLTKYEKTKILGVRAKQLNSGALPYVEVPEHVINGYTIAQMELKEKKIPFIIRRPLPCGASEYWPLKELEDLEY